MGALYKTTETGCQIIADSKGRGIKYTVLFPDGSVKKNLPLKKAEQLCEQYADKMKPKERIIEAFNVINYMSVCPANTPLVISWNKQKKQAAIFIGSFSNQRGNFVFNFFVGNDVLSIIMDGLENLKVYPDESDPALVKECNALQNLWMSIGSTLAPVVNSPIYTPIVVSINGGVKEQAIYIGSRHENGVYTLGFYTQTGIKTVTLKNIQNMRVFLGEINSAMVHALQQRWNEQHH